MAVSEAKSEWFENWRVQMRKGLLDLCILQALLSGEWYGYALVKALVGSPYILIMVSVVFWSAAQAFITAVMISG